MNTAMTLSPDRAVSRVAVDVRNFLTEHQYTMLKIAGLFSLGIVAASVGNSILHDLSTFDPNGFLHNLGTDVGKFFDQSAHASNESVNVAASTCNIPAGTEKLADAANVGVYGTTNDGCTFGFIKVRGMDVVFPGSQGLPDAGTQTIVVSPDRTSWFLTNVKDSQDFVVGQGVIGTNGRIHLLASDLKNGDMEILTNLSPTRLISEKSFLGSGAAANVRQLLNAAGK